MPKTLKLLEVEKNQITFDREEKKLKQNKIKSMNKRISLRPYNMNVFVCACACFFVCAYILLELPFFVEV